MSTVNRRKFIRGAAAGGLGAAAATAVASPAIAQSMPEVKWRMTASWPKSLDTLYGAAEEIAKIASDLTDGKFQIQVFAAGEIVPGLQVLDAVQNGTVECGHTAMYYYFGKDDAMVFGTVLPFGMNARLTHGWLLHGGGEELFSQFTREKYNTVTMLGGQTNCQMGGWFRKEIKTIDDLKGLKFRIGGFAGKIVQRLGVVPQQIAGGDIYPALEKGTIDGAEWVGPYDDEKLGFVKIAPYYYYPGWWEPCSISGFCINQQKFDALPKLYQNVLRTASHHAALSCGAKYDALNPAGLRRLIGAGAKLQPFSPEIMDACWKASNELYTEMNATNPWFKKLYDSYTAFRNDGYLWYQVADYTMDAYMVRYRNSL